MPGLTDNPFHAPPTAPGPAPEPAVSRAPLIPRRAAMAVATTLTALLLLLRLDPGTNPEAQLASAATSPDDSTASDPSSTAAAGSNGTNGGTGGATTASTQATGDAVGTRFGTVQVQVTIDGGTLVNVTALQLPSGGRDSQISAYAEPILRSEALQAGSASIDTVSGATYTSVGYIQSLQSALDTAGIG